MYYRSMHKFNHFFGFNFNVWHNEWLRQKSNQFRGSKVDSFLSSGLTSLGNGARTMRKSGSTNWSGLLLISGSELDNAHRIRILFYLGKTKISIYCWEKVCFICLTRLKVVLNRFSSGRLQTSNYFKISDTFLCD